MKKLIYIPLLALCSAACADITSWPTEWEWNPLYSSSGSLYEDGRLDTANNGHLYLDIIGGFDAQGNEYAGAYLVRQDAASGNQNEAQLMIRIRLNAAKSSDPGAYQVYFETTGDASVNWLLQLETPQQGTPQLTFGAASGTNSSAVLINSPLWTGSVSGYSRYTGLATADGSQFSSKPNGSGDDDYFLDLSMPWDVFSASTGITSTNDPFRALIVSSQSGGNAFDGDVGNTALTTNIKFADAYSDTIPEPSQFSLLAVAGGFLWFARRRFRR